ncbi:focadhesin-like [Pocillopora damicornis]|uniref:focadhesin-like n=1 Tax=Pocillopora damicornis TaxID=46731 RepID=UPI000F54FCFA|nr:focadhesin-like [Pocillopora damicornis]
MADEQRKRLSFRNPSHQSQEVWKLYDCILISKPPGSVINANSVEIPELKLLWELTGDSSEVLSRLCCNCLVQLVVDDHAEFEYIIRGLLSVAPSARNLSGISKALSCLLTFQVYKCTTAGMEYICPFSLRASPHPFITLVISCPESATILIQEVSVLLVNSIKRYLNCDPRFILRMLESFFKFVLLDPNVTVNWFTRQQLLTTLLQTASALLQCTETDHSHEEVTERKVLVGDIIDLLTSLVPCYQIDDKSLSHTTFLVHSLTNWLLEHRNSFPGGTSHLELMVNHLFSLCCESLSFGSDMTSSILLLQTIQHHCPQAFLQLYILPTLSKLLLDSLGDCYIHILQLCLSTVQTQLKHFKPDCLFLPVSHLFLVQPILQIITSPPRQTFSIRMQGGTVHSLHCKALKILGFVENNVIPLIEENQTKTIGNTHQHYASALSLCIRQMTACAEEMIILIRNTKSTKHWLSNLQKSIASHRRLLSHVPLMLSALLVTSQGSLAMEVLEVIPILAKADPSQAVTFLPLILYKLSKEVDPEVKQYALYTIPQLATHKFCIGPVLRTIQTIGKCPLLKPVSLRLICKLWQSNNRVFPHLQKALSSVVDSNLGAELDLEIKIAQAACLLDICKLRPSQHGEDLLGLLSKLLDENTKPGETKNTPSALVVSLALQALEQLCKAEVVDLCTAWKVLSVKLGMDRRPQVLCSICQLFRIVSDLVSNSSAYLDFKNEVLTFLWSLTQHEESPVAHAAFTTLSIFHPSDFKLIHLPPKIYLPLKEELLASKKKLDGNVDEEYDEAAVHQSIDNSMPPGTAYVELLQMVKQDELQGYQKLLTNMIKVEAESMPRGLGHTSSSHERNLRSIPKFLTSQYEKSKSPGLNQGLAAGMLFSFEPPFEQHEGKRARKYMVDCARTYRQMLDSLLHEVPVQPTEWHRTLLLPQAWFSFMNRAYKACVEGRKAELEMQHSHGHIQDTEELKIRQSNCWLWVRDQITKQLRTVSRGNPSVQGNSVLALVGLARAVSMIVRQQTSSETTEQYQWNNEWLSEVADTVMVVLDGNYKPKGPTLVWCQQVSSSSSTASSLLARSCAALSLSLLVPCLVVLDTDRIHDITVLLKQRIPGQSKSGSSASLQMSCSVGLGLLLSKLHEEHFSDAYGKEGYPLMSTALDVLEETAFSYDLDNTEGACLGFGLVVSSLCKEGLADSRDHVTNLYHKLVDRLNEQCKDPGQKLQCLSFSVACVCVYAFHTGLLSADQALQCIDNIQTLSSKHPEVCGISLSLGLLLHGLISCGHGGAIELARQAGNDWRSVLENKDVFERRQLSAVNGIVALLGSEQGLFTMDSSTSDVVFSKDGGSVIKYLQKLVSSPEDLGLSFNTAWLLGHLYNAVTSSSISNTSAPLNYSYLSEGSILRLLFDFLGQAGKIGPHLNFGEGRVPAVLESLVSVSHVALPPVNWLSVLGPIMTANFGEDTRKLCIRLAVNQAQSSSTLSSFLSSLLSSVSFMGLGDLSKRELLKNLSRLVYVISSSKMKEFYEEGLTELWRKSTDCTLRSTILEAYLSVLCLKEPPASVVGWTITALERMFNALGAEKSESECLRLFSRCFALIPIENVERILPNTQVTNTKDFILRCYAVQDGIAPVKWLAPCIDFILNTDLIGKRNKELFCSVVPLIIDSCTKMKYDERQHWFVELIGQFQNAVQLSSETSSHQTLMNSFTLLSLVSAAWCDLPILQGLELPVSTCPPVDVECYYSIERFPWLLPLTLSNLLGKEPWKQIAEKVIDWLLSLRGDPRLKTANVHYMLIQDTLISLRETDAYRKPAVWTKLVAKLHRK